MIATGEIPLTQTQTAALRSRLLLGGGIFLVFALLGLLTFQWDNAVQGWVAQHADRYMRNLAGNISDYGDWPWLMATGIVLAAICWRIKSRWMARTIFLMMLASTIAGMATNTLRLTTGRTRPNAKVEAGWYGPWHEGQLLIGKNKYNSFPSGHTATAFGFFGAMLFRRRSYGLLVLWPAPIIGLSRIMIDAHHLSDVYFGAWFGMVTAWLVVTIYESYESRKNDSAVAVV